MIGQRDDRIWSALGIASAAMMLVFILVALVQLLLAGNGETSSPPLAYLLEITEFTVKQALLSTGISVLFAVPVAVAMARRPRFFGRSALLALMLLPLGLPVLPAIFGILAIWGGQGLATKLLEQFHLPGLRIYGLGGILLAHVFFNLPLAARLFLESLENVPRNEWWLAASLGFKRSHIFWLIEARAIIKVAPGVIGLIFMLCVTSFTIVLTLGGGPATSTLEVAIYQSLKFDFDPSRAFALVAIQLAMTASLLATLRFLPGSEVDRTLADTRTFRPDAKSFGSKLSDSFILFLFSLFVGAPLFALVVEGLNSSVTSIISSELFQKAFLTSVLIALVSAALSTILTFAIIRARLLVRKARGHWIIAIVFNLPDLVLLFPPVALGSGWFLVLLDSGLAERAAIPVVIGVNMLMAMPFVARVLEPELKEHLQKTEKLCANLGLTGFNRLRVIDWPVLRPAILTALGFAMSLSLGDLGAVALFGTDNFITLPALLYAKLGSYRSQDAAGIALILAGLCLLLLIPSILRQRQIRESEND